MGNGESSSDDKSGDDNKSSGGGNKSSGEQLPMEKHYSYSKKEEEIPRVIESKKEDNVYYNVDLKDKIDWDSGDGEKKKKNTPDQDR